MPPMITIISDDATSNSGSVKPPSSRSARRTRDRPRLRSDRAHIARLREVGADGGDVVAVLAAVVVRVGVRRRRVARLVVALRVLDAVPVDAVEGDGVAAGRRRPGESPRAVAVGAALQVGGGRGGTDGLPPAGER